MVTLPFIDIDDQAERLPDLWNLVPLLCVSGIALILVLRVEDNANTTVVVVGLSEKERE